MNNETTAHEIDGRDIDIASLKPLHERAINFATNRGFRKIVASISAIGLIEPLNVFPEGDHFIILNGFLRYMACKQLGLATIPCIVARANQAYTYNKNVNRLSGFQETRMLKKALESINEATVAKTFGLKSIRYRLARNLEGQLHPSVVAAFKDDRVGKNCANEFTNVVPERQVEILAEMKRVSDYSPAFCRTLVIRTPSPQRVKKKGQRREWAADDDRKKALVARLEHAEQQNDFYASLYRRYSTDLLRVTFYIRKMLSVPQIEQHLAAHHAETLTRLRGVVEAAGAA